MPIVSEIPVRVSLLILRVQPPAAGKCEEACCIQEATVGAYGWNVNEWSLRKDWGQRLNHEGPCCSH